MRHTTKMLRRHPRLALVAVNFALFAALLLPAEVFLRFWVPFNPSYYAVFPGQPGRYEFAYGTLIRNQLGFPDEDFDLDSSKLRVGYFGDSVCRGVGAGYGFRIPDLLETARPDLEHWTLASLINGIDPVGSARTLEISHRLELDHVVYLLNLNDLLPDRRGEVSANRWIAWIKRRAIGLDRLRGHSYVYTMIRQGVRRALIARGIGAHGFEAYELQPQRYSQVITQTAERIAGLAEHLSRRQVAFSVVLLPYEMQVSGEAAERFGELGATWEDGFESGSTQRLLIEALGGRVRFFDGLEAFSGHSAEGEPWKAGETFVHDLGDKLDWNHPNRKGHQLLADYLLEAGLLD